jgi:hypothetical protein
MDDGFVSFINWMKDCHETMMEHLGTRKRKIGSKIRFLHLYPYLDLIYVIYSKKKVSITFNIVTKYVPKNSKF